MKKIISILLSTGIIASSIMPLAFVVAPEKPNKTQLELLSIRAVDISTTATGLRDYASIIDSKRKFKVKDAITLCVDFTSKNIAKNSGYLSAAGTEIDIHIASPGVDLSYVQNSQPVIIADIYGSLANSQVAQYVVPDYRPGNTLVAVDISRAISYDKKADTIVVNMAADIKDETDFMDYRKMIPVVSQGRLRIAAPKARDSVETIIVGNNKYEVKFEAPNSVDYKLIMTGVVDHTDNPDLTSRLRVAGIERFKKDGDAFVLDVYDKYKIVKQQLLATDIVETDDPKFPLKGQIKIGNVGVAQINPLLEDGSFDGNKDWAGGVSKSGGNLVSSKIFHATDNKTVLGSNGISVYTICDSNSKPLVSLLTEVTYYEGDAGKSIALFVPDDGVIGYARRIEGLMGGRFIYASDGTEVVNSKDIFDAIKYFGFDMGINSTYKLMDFDFEKKAASAIFTQNVNGRFNSTPSNPGIDNPTDGDDDEDGGLIEEDPDDDEVDKPTKPNKPQVPQTGDFDAQVATALIITAAIAFGAFKLITNKNN